MSKPAGGKPQKRHFAGPLLFLNIDQHRQEIASRWKSPHKKTGTFLGWE